MTTPVAASSADLAQPFKQAELEIAKAVIGQRALVRRLLIGLLCDGHLLLEGVPGLAKTTVVKALAGALDAQFRRIQFTPDLLPADIIGTRIWEAGTFATRKGPIFAQLILADEINRAPAKVQSALLEAMQERQVTIGEETFALPRPFIVVATQNPIEQEGTYPLPEAQTDRFLMKVRVDYPAAADERTVLDRHLEPTAAPIRAVLDAERIASAQRALLGVHLDARIRDYCVALVRATRPPCALPALLNMIELGASPRAAIGLALAARARATLRAAASPLRRT